MGLEHLQASFAQELEVLGRCQHPNILHMLAVCLTPPRPCLVMEVLHIASEIALGLAYLHPTILHRDLKPANVLINDPWGERPIVKLSDIYSYGVLLWEMLAGIRPWEGIGALCQLLEECWDKDPERRPAAAEVAKRVMLVQQRKKPPSEQHLKAHGHHNENEAPAAAVGVGIVGRTTAGGRCQLVAFLHLLRPVRGLRLLHPVSGRCLLHPVHGPIHAAAGLLGSFMMTFLKLRAAAVNKNNKLHQIGH
ncbi:Serine/threonine-protein kinase HT1 [Tetrabaena socialis]|uniref:Serine/threonine-protein kinase HT1 n=1 Tax=Tetrabaena socialis TaxID=47790 RepID=A0A2J8ADA7_9CHLO|nr:Serine/threonine-protein kinase HT1 [Tetrabaena socialis]|eukprot:PNH10501.1 Serine/threonine-protein kinase HT1 [Tetrabaena socialis]